MGFEYWFMFPIAIVVATCAMSTLVGGATFFSPIFILLLKLEPHVAIATALMTQLFGFGTGLVRYISKKCIDYTMGTMILFITIPYAILGSWIVNHINPFVIRLLLGIIVVLIGYMLLVHNKVSIRKNGKEITSFIFKEKRYSKKIVLKNRDIRKNMIYAGIGAFFLGSTSAGLGELLGFNWIKKTDAELRTIVSTTVFVIAITTFATSVTHFYSLFTTNLDGLYQAFDILIFTIPGVIIGALIGVHLIHKINQQKLQKVIAVVLLITGVLCLIPF